MYMCMMLQYPLLSEFINISIINKNDNLISGSGRTQHIQKTDRLVQHTWCPTSAVIFFYPGTNQKYPQSIKMSSAGISTTYLQGASLISKDAKKKCLLHKRKMRTERDTFI